MESEFVKQKVSEAKNISAINENVSVTPSLRPIANLLRLTYGIVPIVAGLDKFTNLLTDWEKYLHPGILNILPFSPRVFMMIIGIIEIVAGILVLRAPRVGGIIVAAWLTLIALTLIASGNYLDVAVRDLVMAIGAFSLVKLTRISS
jgi:uncharacterized membrane protein YphA (DoxX/SURF4 family)